MIIEIIRRVVLGGWYERILGYSLISGISFENALDMYMIYGSNEVGK